MFRYNEYQLKPDDRQFLDYIPPVSILLGGLIFLMGTVAAIFLYETPGGKYQFFDQFFSELGLREDYIAELDDGGTEYRYAPEFPEIFNISLFASGFLMIPFFLFSYRQMRNESFLSNFCLIWATTFGVLAGPFMIGVGIFDLSFSSDIFWQQHGFWVAWLYIFITGASIFWFFMLIFSRNLPYHTSKWIWMDYLFLVLLVSLITLNISDALLIPIKDIPLVNAYSIETYQKIIPYLFFMYYGLVVGVRLTKTKYDNTPVIHEETNLDDAHVSTSDIYCTNCGQPSPEGSPFCTICGAEF